MIYVNVLKGSLRLINLGLTCCGNAELAFLVNACCDIFSFSVIVSGGLISHVLCFIKCLSCFEIDIKIKIKVATSSHLDK